ncbi:MAG: hypothetical protein PF569_07660 [Candidatus Woesearchaeota archaeon]|nr:hypothetical protein [Candidatus Woesearchaeota archaeon]
MKAFVYQDYTIYNYAIEFQTNDSISKFSIEKPKDAKIDYAVDKFGTVNYESVGDFFIFKPKGIEDNYFLIKYRSEDISNNLFKADAFRTYLSFDFPVDNLIFNLEFKDNFGEGIDIFPTNFLLDESGRVIWDFESVEEDLLFVVNFKDTKSNIETGFINRDLIYLTIIFILLILVVSLLILYKTKIKNKTSKSKVNVQENIVEIRPEEKISNEVNLPQEENRQTIEEIVKKHLTENESEVLLLIKDNDGISQYDILNYLPKLTKSNLSKIISKLHARKILKRIKVGKANKIYIGDRIKKEEN